MNSHSSKGDLETNLTNSHVFEVWEESRVSVENRHCEYRYCNTEIVKDLECTLLANVFLQVLKLLFFIAIAIFSH